MRRDEYEKYYRKQNYVKCGAELYAKFYRTYDNIKTRCYNKKNHKYKQYGIRGIVMCDEWLQSREAFIKWCDKHCKDITLTIERIDVNGNYEPNNCRWISMEQQAKNKQNSIKVNYYGTEYCLRDLCSKLGYNHNEYKRIHARIAYEKWDVYKAIETPINHQNNKQKYLKPSYTYKGYTNSLRQICKRFNLNYTTIKYRVIRGMSVKDACDKGTEKPYTYIKRVSNLGGKHFDKH